MPKLVILAAFFLAGFAPATAQDDIGSFCAARWAADYEMQEHCVKEQSRSHTRMRNLYGRLKSEFSVRNPALFRKSVDVIERCLGRWSDDRGYDWTMVDHCTKGQMAAATRLAARAVKRPAQAETRDGYSVVVGSFSDPANAGRMVERLNGAGLAYTAHVTRRRPGDPLHRVIVGRSWPRAQAEVVRDALLASGVVDDAFLSDFPDVVR